MQTIGLLVEADAEQATGAERERVVGGRVELQVVQRLDGADDAGAGEPREARNHRVLYLAGHHDARALELLEREARHAALREHHVGPQAQNALHLMWQVRCLLRTDEYNVLYTVYSTSDTWFDIRRRLHSTVHRES